MPGKMKTRSYSKMLCVLFAAGLASAVVADPVSVVLYDGERTITGAYPTDIGRSFISGEGDASSMPTLFVRDTTVYHGDDLVAIGSTNYLGNAHKHWGRLVVSNANWLSTCTTKATADQAGQELNAIILGYRNGVGILEIQNGGFVSNKVIAACGNTSGNVHQGYGVGAIYVNPGARLFQTICNNKTTYVGPVVGLAQDGHGYIQQTGGLIGGEAVLISAYGAGVFHMYGGRVETEDQVKVVVCNSGRGVLYVTNGTVKAEKVVVNLCNNRWGIGQVTVDGPGAFIDTSKTFHVNDAVEDRTFVNINHGGTLKCLGFHSGKAVSEYTYQDDFYVVSFNGGILQAATANTPFFMGVDGNLPSNGVGRVVVAEEGATIDTAGYTCRLPAQRPLEGVVEGGIQSISLDEPVAGLAGAPLVTIANVDTSIGAGYGATAVADWDPETRTLSGVIVTSRGWGYVQGNVKVTLKTAYAWNKELTGDAITVGDNSIGGFTKRGAGVLTSYGTNTWQKWTRIEAGTFKVGAERTIPPNTELQLAGGTLDLNDIAGTTFCGISGTGGTVQNGSVKIVGEWKVSAKRLLSGDCTDVDGIVDLTGCTCIRIVDTDDVKPAAPTRKDILSATEIVGLADVPVVAPSFRWKIEKTGNLMRLRYVRGFLVCFR